MRQSRRKFIQTTALLGGGILIGRSRGQNTSTAGVTKPVVISTWDHGFQSNARAFEILNSGGNSLDAVEKGVMVAENDPEVTSVGYGGLPDEDGNVTLDACIMDWKGNAGSVAFLKGIKNPISVARRVMETTKHVMLVGEGALRFALANGFREENLLTEESRKKWLEWRRKRDDSDNWLNPEENHDTIGMLAIDSDNRMSGAVTTSGLAFKIHGRVGDSPIIGAALYVDNEVGGACATGVGELVIKTVGSFLIVEKMREGLDPEEACRVAVNRISKIRNIEGLQVGFLAMNISGRCGAYSLRKGFRFAVGSDGKNEMADSKYMWD